MFYSNAHPEGYIVFQMFYNHMVLDQYIETYIIPIKSLTLYEMALTHNYMTITVRQLNGMHIMLRKFEKRRSPLAFY